MTEVVGVGALSAALVGTSADPVVLDGLAARLLAHHLDGTTDFAASTMQVPVTAYFDPERYRREVDAVFKRSPLAVALSIELREPHSYRALVCGDVPVLLTRDADGRARAFINACRHRGAPVVENGCGTARRFTCPYHAWVYDGSGALVGMFGAETFGDVDRNQLGLTELPCEERSGFVWVVLTPGLRCDVESWLHGMDRALDGLQLDGWHLFEQREIPGPGWKVTWDGYLEGYHQQSLHPETVGKDTIANLMVVDTFGPHQRFAFGRKNLGELASLDRGSWDVPRHIRLIHSIFPNVSISGILADFCLVSHVFPGPDPWSTRTIQSVLTKRPPKTADELSAAESFSTLVLRAVRDEDYAVGQQIQSALLSKGNTHFVFGRNEPTLHHFHQWIDRITAANGWSTKGTK